MISGTYETKKKVLLEIEKKEVYKLLVLLAVLVLMMAKWLVVVLVIEKQTL